MTRLLDPNEIQKLLDKEVGVEHPRPIQIGPLRWGDKTDRCASRGCSSPTFISVNGIPYCATHALYALNRELIGSSLAPYLSECNCNAGKHSMGNLHTEHCPIYVRVKEN